MARPHAHNPPTTDILRFAVVGRDGSSHLFPDTVAVAEFLWGKRLSDWMIFTRVRIAKNDIREIRLELEHASDAVQSIAP